MISRLVTKAAVIGVAATFAIAAPASAAATPTLSGPVEVAGYSQFEMTGTADPGSTVTLWETAIGWNDMQPAVDYEAGSGNVTAVANGSGQFTISRYLDSGFYFEVHQGSVISNRITVYSKIVPTFWVESSPTAGSVVAKASLNPNMPGLSVQIQRKNSGGSFTTVKTVTSSEPYGDVSTTLTGQPGGDQTFRAVVAGEASQGVRGATSATHSTWITGGTTTPTTPPTTTPPSTPAVGAIQFTKIQYDSPGTDSGSAGSLNTEWAKLTNKTTKAINLNAWTVRDAQNIIYKFPNINLAAGASIFVLTGKGTNTATHRYWGRAGKSGYVWNNTGDTAYLRTAASKTIDSCKWTALGAGNTNC